MFVFLSLGSNISPRHHYIDAACRLLEQRVGPILRRSSDFYSAPWGYTSDHQYLNIALLLSSSLSPEQLLVATQLIERELGRTVKNHYQDRTIDIDILRCFSSPASSSASQAENSCSSASAAELAPSPEYTSPASAAELAPSPEYASPASAAELAPSPEYTSPASAPELFPGSEITISTPDLVIPHPLMWQRPFVMVPLREVSAGFPLPSS